MGEDYVRGMCHDIEDPTFDATTVATNARVQIRPIHRPPRIPADRHPVCARTVVIDDSHPEVTGLPSLAVIEKIRAASWEMTPIDESDDGLADSGPLLSDFDFTAYSQSALVRMADEVRLQMHLLNLSFVLAVQRRAIDDDQDRGIAPYSSSGWPGLPPNAFTRPSQPASRPGWCAADDGIASNVQSEGIHRRQVRGRADSVATAAPPTTTEHGLRCVTRIRESPCGRSRRRWTPTSRSMSSGPTRIGRSS